MQIHFGVDLLHAEWSNAVVCVGTFDGVHLGHRAVIHEAVCEARASELPCVLLTFDRHPAHVLAPERCPKAIASLQDNLGDFEAIGVGVAVILQFDERLSKTPAQEFLDRILLEALKAGSLVVGHDFAMGHGREGDTAWLLDRIPTTVIPPFQIDGHRVSSSEIRSAVGCGDVGHAHRLLGKPFAVGGVVVHGKHLGRTLGYPTVNLGRSFDQVLPRNGIYAGVLTSDFGRHVAAVSIGTRPTVSGEEIWVEAHLLDYTGESLYGRSVRLELMHRLRDEAKFDSLDALVEQIASDVQTVRTLMAPIPTF